MRGWIPWLTGAICAFSFPVWSQQRPLKTDDAELVGTGRIRTEFGFEFLQNQRYSLSGLEGDLTRFGVTSLHFGMGEYAEFQVSGVIQDFLSISNRTTNPPFPPDVTGNSTHDFGDLVLASKLKLASEKGFRPGFAFKFAVELPNAKHPSGLGTDETEFYAIVLMSKHLGRAELIGDVGFAVLQNPVVAGRQTDSITYGLAFIYPLHKSVNFVGEINGRQGPPNRIGNENQSVVRSGFQIWVGPLRWDVAGIAGLQDYDPSSGVTVGVTYEFQAFHKKPAIK